MKIKLNVLDFKNMKNLMTSKIVKRYNQGDTTDGKKTFSQI